LKRAADNGLGQDKADRDRFVKNAGPSLA
jgi:hypothetical protein